MQRGFCVGVGHRLSVRIYIADRLVLTDIQLQIAGGGVKIFAGGGRDKQQGKIRLGGVIHQGAGIGQLFAQRGSGIRGVLGVFQKCFGIDFFVRALVGGQGQGTVIFQQHHAAAMGIRGGFPIAGGGHNACGFVRVAVGVLKHSQGKQFRQGAGHGTVQCFIRQG